MCGNPAALTSLRNRSVTWRVGPYRCEFHAAEHERVVSHLDQRRGEIERTYELLRPEDLGDDRTVPRVLEGTVVE